MLIDRVKIVQKQGLGGIVLLSLLLFTAWVAFLMLIARLSHVKLRNEPRVLLGKVPLGGAVLWGAVVLTIGLLGMVGGFSSEMKGDDWFVMLGVMLPMVLSGLLMFIYRKAYVDYRLTAEEVLGMVRSGQELSLAQILLKAGGRKLTARKLFALLDDLRTNRIIDYREKGDGRFEAWFVAPELTSEGDGAAAKGPERNVKWTCPSCGAPNTTAADGSCVFCGTGRPAAENTTAQ